MVCCPSCAQTLTLATRGVEETVVCPSCRAEVTAVVWPAADRDPGRRASSTTVAGAGEAACFSCPERAATGVCAGCGCFTCPACEADWFGESLCLTCLHARRELEAAPRFVHRTLVYDNIALMLLVLPVLCVPFYGILFAFLASPVVLFLVLRHRHASRGLPPRGPFRLILAGGLAVLLMLGVVAGIGTVAYSIFELTRALGSSALETEAELEADGDPSAAEDGSSGEEESQDGSEEETR
jgi:hypothetical protein